MFLSILHLCYDVVCHYMLCVRVCVNLINIEACCVTCLCKIAPHMYARTRGVWMKIYLECVVRGRFLAVATES